MRTKGVAVSISLGCKVAAVLIHVATAFDETISNDDGNSYGTQDIGARLFAKVVGELNSCSQNVENLEDANGVGVHFSLKLMTRAETIQIIIRISPINCA